MVLTARERMLIQFGVPLSDDLGEEALTELSQVYARSKIYFPHIDPIPGFNDSAIMNMDNIRMDPSGLHASNLRINFKLLCRCILVSTAANHPGLLMDCAIILELDNFLRRAAAVLVSRDR